MDFLKYLGLAKPVIKEVYMDFVKPELQKLVADSANSFDDAAFAVVDQWVEGWLNS